MDQWTAINTRWICFRHFSTRPRLLPVFLLLESYFAILFRHCCTATVIPTKMKCEVKWRKFREYKTGFHRIGSDWTFYHLVIIHTTGPKKLKILQLFIIRVADHRFKLQQKIGIESPCAGSILLRSHAYLPERKSALKPALKLNLVVTCKMQHLGIILK